MAVPNGSRRVMNTRRHCIVAGLSGQVGQGLLEAVTGFGEQSAVVSAIVRRRRRSNLDSPNVVVDQHIGDVTLPFWGLDVDAEQSNDVDVVVNLAGIVDWTASQAEMNRVNYLGAVNGLRLAEALSEKHGRTVPYVYASTTYVAGTSSGLIAESLHPADPDRSVYELSKWYAEQTLISEARSTGHPVLVARIGGVIGSSITDETVRKSSLYQLVASLRQAEWRYLPVRSGGRVDILPRNIIGEGLLRLISAGAERNFEPWRGGRLVHLCAGDRAPTLEALFSVLKAMDCDQVYSVPKLIAVNDGTLRLAENIVLKYMRWDREKGNRLFGLRYVSIDRIFETTNLTELTDGWYPEMSLDDIVRITFGLGRARKTTVPGTDYPFGRLL
ncbi:SDR family oxidoreductase [Nocardia sp. NPDC055002]